MRVCPSYLVFFLFFSGCASIMSRPESMVTIRSKPSGASFLVRDRDGLEIDKGITPASVMLRTGAGFWRSATYSVTLEHDGFQPATREIAATMNGWYIGNVVFGGFLGLLLIDPGTGCMWCLPRALDHDFSAGPSGVLPIPPRPPPDPRVPEASTGGYVPY